MSKKKNNENKPALVGAVNGSVIQESVSSSSSSSSNSVAAQEELAYSLICKASSIQQLEALESLFLAEEFTHDPLLIVLLEREYNKYGKSKFDLSSAQTTYNIVSAHITKLNKFSREGHYGDVIDYFYRRQLLTKFPWHAQFYADLGNAYCSLDEPPEKDALKEAIQLFKKSVEIYSKREKLVPVINHDEIERNLKNHSRLSLLYLENSQYKEAARQSETLIALCNKQIKNGIKVDGIILEAAYKNAVAAYLAQENEAGIKSAKVLLETITKKIPNDLKSLGKLIKILYSQGNQKEAEELFGQAISNAVATGNEEIFNLFAAFGIKEVELQDLLKTHSSKVTDPKEASFFAYIYLNMDYRTHYKWLDNEWIRESERLLEFAPDDLITKAMNCQVKIRQHVNRGYIPSAKRFKEIDKLALDDSLPMKVKEIIAYTYDIAGEYQKLANYLDKIQALPDYLIELKSQAHRRLGEFAKALDLVKMLYQKGYCNMNYIKSALMNDHFFLGHYSEAFSLAKQLIENKHIQITQNDTVFSYLYHTYLNLQNHDQVIEICENYLKNSPPYDRACVNLLAAAYFNKMEFSKAKEQVQRMVDVDPEDKIALINLANICLLLEENELAAEYWTRALELEPTLLKDKDDLIAVLEKVGIWNKIASYAKSDRSAGVESMPRSSKVEMSSSSLASSESAYKPTNQAPAKAEQKRDAGLWVNKIGSPTIRRNFLTLAPVSSSPVTGSLEGSSSKTDLWDNLRDKQAIIDYTKQAIQKEGEKQVAILLKDSSKLGFVPSYQREVRKETKKLERKEEGKGQAPIPKPSDRDIYAIDGGKLYVKLDYRNVEEQVRNQGHGSSDDVMKDINTALETRRIARLEGQSGIKYLSATTVELKLTGRFSKDIRVLGEIREGSYQNKQGETVKYKYAILSSVKNHQEIARGVG